MSLIERKLRVLQFPEEHFGDLDFSGIERFSQLVLWLEDAKIRLWPIENRTPLRNPALFWETFAQYLRALACPLAEAVASPQDHRDELIDFMSELSRAIQLEYTDRAAQFNAAASASEEFRTALHTFAELLHVPHSDSLATVLANVNEAVKQLAAEPRERLAQTAYTHWEQLNKMRGFVQSLLGGQLSSGVSMGDPSLDRGAAVLRALYLRQLRELQTAVNNALSAVQEATAKPKVDASLGKVGR